MNPDYVAGLEAETTSPSVLDWIRAGADIYKTVATPTPAPVPAPAPPGRAPAGVLGFSPMTIAAAVLALVGVLFLALRRN